MSPLLSRVSPLALLASLSISSAVVAADVNVPANTTVSGQKTFGGTDKVTVGAGGRLTSTANPTLNQTSASTGVLIDNFGTIESTGTGARAIRFNSGTTMSFTLTNEAGATIQSQNDALQVGTAVASGTIVVNNSGLIQATGTGSNNGQAIDFGNIVAGTASITINNFATGVLQTADADGIRPGNKATVNNYGQIISNNFQTNSGADGIDFQTSTGGTVNNYAGGLISGGRHGINISYDPTANATTSSITVINYAGGQIIGRNGSGVGSDVGGTVINYGLISGDIDNIAGVANGDGDGVDIDYIGNITNYGTIRGTGAKGVGSDGKTNTSQGVAIGGGVIDNKAGATIIGQADGILVDNSSEGPAFGAVTITNAGAIQGTTRYGIYVNSTLSNTITNSGTITGGGGQAIVFGSGDDTLNIRTGSVINGTVDGGAGNDRVSLSGTGSFAGAINFETLSVDDGVWTLTGTQSYSSGVTVASGAELVASGAIGNLVAIAAGGRLSGSGTLGALDLSGVVSPGSGAGAISTLSITGNATFRSGSVYQVNADAAGAADKIIVGGTATLGGSVQVTAASGNYAPATTYSIVQATGGVSGSFASVSADLAFLTPSLSYNANNAFLTLSRNGVFFQSVAANRNQRAVAAALDTTPTASPLFLAVVGKSAAGARAAFDGLSGEGVAGALNVGLESNRLFGSTLSDAGQFWRTGETRDPNGITVLSSPALSYASLATKKGPIDPRPTQEPAHLWRIWLSGFGQSARIGGDATLGSATQQASLGGGAIGLDAALLPNLLLGLAGGYSAGGATTNLRSTHVDTHGWHIGGYGVYTFDPNYISASLSFSDFDNYSRRTIFGVGTGETANGNFESRVLRARVEVGRDVELLDLRVTPFAAVETAHVWTDGFSETTALVPGVPGLGGLTFAARETDSLPVYFGARLRRSIALEGGGRLTPDLSIAYVHEFEPARDLTATFGSASSAAFTIAGARPDSNFVQAKAGLRLDMSASVAIFASFEGEYGGHTQSYAGKGGVKIVW
ncbi:MAG TPA: autotransporter domain-containing protein [Methylosinus sp.]|jgi:outer membrane autotransporter protein|uniref:autotransporter outer membrane beta-barrel domain-containing protein n=1 Tax=Methylosinus sp. TaxID=427 RepID=UPI002F922DDC